MPRTSGSRNTSTISSPIPTRRSSSPISRASSRCRGPRALRRSCAAIRRRSRSSCSSPARRRAGGGRRCRTRARSPAAIGSSRPPCARRAPCRCGRARRRGTPRWPGLLPPLALGSVVVISDGGGHATIVCDAADRGGLAVPELSGATRDRLGEILRRASGIVNPVDFAGLAEEEPEVVPRVVDRLSGRARDRRRDPRRPLRRLLQDRDRGAGTARAGGGPPRDRGGPRPPTSR